MKRKLVVENEKDERPLEKKVKGDVNYLTGKPYSDNYFKIL